MEVIYSYLIRASWGFLLGWVVLLLVAGVIAFRRDLS
jgi:biotin transporter BioY